MFIYDILRILRNGNCWYYKRFDFKLIFSKIVRSICIEFKFYNNYLGDYSKLWSIILVIFVCRGRVWIYVFVFYCYGGLLFWEEKSICNRNCCVWKWYWGVCFCVINGIFVGEVFLVGNFMDFFCVCFKWGSMCLSVLVFIWKEESWEKVFKKY